MEIGVIRQVDIEREMQSAYLDYAMSVIVARALPDVRDGLKPVQRRILYAMHDMGLRSDGPYRKSARIVGEVLGKYHPHGDAAVYETMARLAQDFSMRALLVDGQGNFGSIDGDPPAAMRYTEARMTALAEEMLADIEKETVDSIPNFDSSLVEPSVLPAKVPNFLVNGATGIAVAMATNVPPHNLGEICDALAYMIDQMVKGKGEDVSVEELLQFVQGPDFPTGGVVYRYAEGVKPGTEGSDLIGSAYAVGRGHFTVQALAHIEETTRNRSRIVVTELPYQVNKTNLIERIAELARDAKIEGITDLRDESDRQGMRIVVELTRTVEPRDVLAQLFKLTPMQQTFGMNMLALVDGEPRMLSLKRALQLFVDHRQEIVTRRSRYELNRARQRAHVLEGLLIALANLDEVIATIRSSRTVDTARDNLRRKFKLTEIQAQAILDMQLRRLAALERQKIEAEYKETLKRIKYLEDLLRSPKKILGVVKDELLEIKEKYNTPRRTQIVTGERRQLTTHDLVTSEDVVVAVSRDGRVCRWPAGQGFEPARGRHKDPLVAAAPANTRDNLYLFTADGKTVVVSGHQVPVGAAPGEGLLVAELAGLAREMTVTAALALPKAKDEAPPGYLFLASRQGRVKRVTLADLAAARTAEITVMNVDEGDELGWAVRTAGGEEVVLVISNGQAIRFSEEEVRPMGLPAGGVMGVKMTANDRVVGMGVVRPRGDVIVISEMGIGKRSALSEYPTQGRYGGGVASATLSRRTGQLAAGAVANVSDRVLMVSEKGSNKVMFARSLPKARRATLGQELIAIRGQDRLQALLLLPPSEAGEAPEGAEGAGEVEPVVEKSVGDGKPAAKPAKPAKAAKTVKPAAKPAKPAKAVAAAAKPAKPTKSVEPTKPAAKPAKTVKPTKPAEKPARPTRARPSPAAGGSKPKAGKAPTADKATNHKDTRSPRKTKKTE